MTSEITSHSSDAAHAERHHDGSDLFDELRQRRLTLFRERQNDLETDETTPAR